MNKKFWALTLTLIATVTLALATTSFSSSATQGKVSMNDISLVRITGDDIRNLPSGENRIVRETEDGNASYVGNANGGVWKLTNGGTSVPLNKIGTGTLIFPNTYRGMTHIDNGAQNSANNNSSATKSTGVTKVGAGTLEHSANNNPSLTKELTGTLILATTGVVYEFRGLGPQDFGHVVVPTADLPQEQINLPYVNIKTRVQQHRPASAMKGWPFARLLIGPAQGIAQVEGWKPGLKNKPTPGSKYVCSGSFCACSGALDCLSLADSGSCSSAMNCDGTGSSTKCYCKSK